MALFFDSSWFDTRLKSLGLSRSDLGKSLGLSEQQIVELWKDQRELTAREVRIIAALLGAPPAEIAQRAGISTPVPKDDDNVPSSILERLDRIDKTLAELKGLVHAIDRATRRNA
jgi:transcriptional regulator with XRE-family HTH domain